MENKGIRIENCPRCGKRGLLIERLTVTRNGLKKYIYRKLNVAHYAGCGISKNGKPVDRIKWCYLNVEQLKQLQITRVRQTFTQNVTQNVRQNENQNSSFFSKVNMAGPRGFEPQSPAPQTPSFYQIPSDLNNLLEQFRTFMRGQLSLCNSTADSNFYLVGKFLREVNSPVTREVVADCLLKIQNTSTRSNYLKALKHFFRDFLGNNIVSSFKLPLPNENPTPCPIDEAVRLVYNNLDYDRDKLIFSLAATTGLRRGEILNLKRKHIDTKNRAITPHKYTRTKRTGITFYNGEVEPLLHKFLDQLTDPEARLFHNGEAAFRKQLKDAWEKAGAKVTLKMLRVWFCNKMGELGVQDRYIDIFCGRAPKSVLAKHYTSNEIEKLKQIYGKANLRMLASTSFQ